MAKRNSSGTTLGEALIDILKSYGVKYIFGVRGGGSSLELIAAAEQAGLGFVLCKGETSAALAALRSAPASSKTLTAASALGDRTPRGSRGV